MQGFLFFTLQIDSIRKSKIMKTLFKFLFIKIIFSLMLISGFVSAQAAITQSLRQDSFQEITQKIDLDGFAAQRLIALLHEYQSHQKAVQQELQRLYQTDSVSRNNQADLIKRLEAQDEILFRKVQGILNPEQLSTFVVLFKEYKQTQRSVNPHIDDNPVSPAFHPFALQNAAMRAPPIHTVYSGSGLSY